MILIKQKKNKKSWFVSARNTTQKMLLAFLFFATIFTANAQKMNFDKNWISITKLENEGKTKDALEATESILQNATKENNTQHIIKALLYKYRYMQTLKDSSELQVVKDLKQNIEKYTGAEKAVLQSILAELYWQYYAQNSWKFAQRTETEIKQSDDFQTWDLKTLMNEVKTYYIASLSEKEILQKVDLSTIDILISKQNESKKYRPTLYDLLAHRAIDFFNNDYSNLTEPKNAFSINDEKYFATASSFAKINIETEDQNSKDFLAIKIFQDLIQFRLNNKQNLDALADADIKRLQYIKTHYGDKDQNENLYFKALQRLQTEYVKCNEGAFVNYLVAQEMTTKASTKQKDFTYTLKDALQLCNQTIQNYPSSDGANNCKSLKEAIERKELGINTESFVEINQNNKALISYKNIDKIYFKLIKITLDEKTSIFEIPDNNKIENLPVVRLNKKTVFKNWTQDLPNNNDYLPNSTEIKFDKLDKGCYVLMSSTNANFDPNKGRECVTTNVLQSTQIAYLYRQDQDYTNNNKNFDLYILDRTTGLPLQNAKVTFYTQDYDYNTRKYKKTFIGTFTSDKDGYVKTNIVKKANQKQTNFDIEYNNDKLINAQSLYFYDNGFYEPTDITNQMVLFTDRAIYRPGQTIYFKGILTEHSNNKQSYKAVPNTSVSVTFRDANEQEIKTIELTTNEFGSVTGTFTAPNTGLLGEMYLQSSYSANQTIRVEEYKRPTFEVKFDAIKKAYNLNDKITVTGKATSYAGANLDNAEVKYTVSRKAQLPVWCYWGWYSRCFMPPNFSSNEKIILNGTTKTDANGNFTIDFDAIPDLTVSKELKPNFDYEIKADVIDITGETHSENTSVKVGYLAIDASFSAKEKWNANEKNKINIITNNLNGEFEPTDVNIKISKLKEPNFPLRERLLSQPQSFTISKTEYNNLFPYDRYKDEEDVAENWQKIATINTYKFNTNQQKEIEFNTNQLQQGTYLIEFNCKDKNGNIIELKKSFSVFSFNDKQLNPKEFVSFDVDKTTAKVGESFNVRIGTSMPKTYVIVEIYHRGKTIETKKLFIENSIQYFSFNVKEEYRGGIEIKYATFTKNRQYVGGTFITVPFEEKALDIEWITFRDKLLPNAKETWKLKIKGKNKEKVAAELLATMYDASLDAFIKHSWNVGFEPMQFNTNRPNYTTNCYGAIGNNFFTNGNWNIYYNIRNHSYDYLNLFGLQIGNGYYRRHYRGGDSWALGANKSIMVDASGAVGMEMDMMVESKASGNMSMAKKENGFFQEESKSSLLGNDANQKPTEPKTTKPNFSPRTNLNETAFFFPQLQTDEDGNIILNFQIPEALTKWNFLGLATTKDLKYSYFTKSIVTQKELMVTPNAPRFLREGDKLSFSTKITNLSDKDLNGTATLILKDAITGKEINTLFKNNTTQKPFAVGKGLNTIANWEIEVPQGVDAVTYEVYAQADNFTDGESKAIPVLPNRMLVTETMPLWITGKGTKKYTFDKLVNNKSTTLKHYNLTLEMTSQPVWYAVQALPYMIEYPYECAEQLFSRYYANTLATFVANNNPKIQEIYNKWKNTDALLSNLEKNQELKNIIIEETPWVRDAQNETEQKKRIALLFDFAKMKEERANALDKLLKMQTPNGGFTWFPGMPDNRYITQHIVCGFGHLEKLGADKMKDNQQVQNAIEKATNYLDDRMREDYLEIKKWDKNYLKTNHLSYDVIHYLYARSFYLDNKVDKKNKEAYDYFFNQAKTYWLNNGLYAQAMLALALNRNGEKTIAKKVVYAINQNSIHSEELGMYWKALEKGGWYWYEAPIETQSLLIEAFHEVTNDEKSVDEMKVWLLKQKQTTSWKSTKATAEACYALLLNGTNWVQQDAMVEVKMNNQIIDPIKMQGTVEPGTGYYKVKWNAENIQPSLGKIELKKTDKGPAWGALYWQYFEQLDKITGANTNIKIAKKLFKEVNTDKGKILQEITDKTPLNPGDLVKVRIEIRTDRNMEYVHLKDMRAAGFEPTNVLSQYKYQDNLGYYESTKDVATHFFIDWLAKGVYVFEYPLRATVAGNFSNGITQIECMYAPEFKAQSNGERVNIIKK